MMLSIEKKVLLVLYFMLCFTFQNHAQDTAQYDLIDLGLKIFKKEAPRAKDAKSKKVRFSIMPASNSSGKVSVSAINFAFYLADPDSTNISTIYFYPYTNFNGRYSFVVNSNVWSFKNKYNLVSDLRISAIEIEDHGLGSDNDINSYALLEYKSFRARLLMNRLIVRYLYFGLGYYLDYYDKIQGTPQGDFSSDFETYPYGTQQSHTSSGLVMNILRDNRKNSINPDNGFYTNFSYQFYHPVLGSTYRWSGFLADARKYIRLSEKKRHLLALHFLYWGTFGESPYLDLPATFTDREARMGRGYYYARYRGGQLLYGETEYRFNLSRNGFWGGVLFANLQSYTKGSNTNFMGFDPSVGFGFRLKFNKQSNANLTVDFGFGKDSFNWHLNIGEFF
ncbi:MAG: hypothetical protein JNK73_14095 [Bacteroidia bacterium]|nr:hypothetical protein [Bacteroidia bacterium]